MIELMKAILTAYRLKDEPLSIQHHKYVTRWDSSSGKWLEYKTARDVIAGHRKIEAALKKVGAI